MAKRSKDERQESLFDIAPIRPKRASAQTTVKYTPMKREPTMVIIHYIGEEDVAHAFCPQSMVEGSIEFSKNFSKQNGYAEKTFKVMGQDDYWEKFHAGGFELGKAS